MRSKHWLATLLALVLVGPAVETSRANTIAQEPVQDSVVQGRVTTPEGTPIAGASVTVRPVASRYREQLRWLEGAVVEPPLAESQTGAEGHYRLTVPRAEVPGVAGAQVFNAQVFNVQVVEVSIRREGRLPVFTRRVLGPPGSQSQPATLPTARLVVDRGSRVEVVGGPGEGGAPLGEGFASGLWLLADSRQGTPEVGVGWRPHRPPIRVTSSEMPSVHLPRAEGETLRVDLVTAGVAVLDRGTTEGRLRLDARAEWVERQVHLVDPQGQPQASALVTDPRGPVLLGVTDSQGSVSLRLPAALGLLRLEVLTLDGAVRRTHLPTFVADQPMTPEELETISTLRLEPIRWFEGQVLGPQDRPIAGAWVFSDHDPGQGWPTDRSGRFRVPASPFRSLWRIGAPGYVETGVAATGEARAIVARLERSATWHGRVVDGRGRGLAGVLVSATIPSPRRRGAVVESLATSNDQGEFALTSLPSTRRVEIHTEHPRWTTSRRWASFEAAPLQLVLTPRRMGTGRVVDLDERPVAGARVGLSTEGSDRNPRTVTTDSEGYWRAADLPEGPLTLEVAAAGFTPFVVRGIEIAPKVDEPGDGEVLGTAETVDLGTVILEPGRRLVGQVLDGKGEEVVGARVELGAPGVEGGREASTDGRGRFEFLGLPATTATLRVRAAGFAPAKLSGVPVPTEHPPTIRLDRATSLLGRVVDGAGTPIAGAEVEIRGRVATGHHGERRATASLRASAVSGADGRFVFDSLPSGPAELVAVASGYQPSIAQAVELSDQRSTEIEIVLVEGLAVPGRVRTRTGRPLAETRVVVGDRAATTDLEGRFVLDGLAPGTVELLVVDRRTGKTPFEVTLVEGMEPLDLVVPEGHGLRGWVLDGSGRGIGAASLRVQALDRGGRSVADLRSDSEGQFEIEGLGAGAYRLVAQHPDHGFADLEVTLDSGISGGETWQGDDLRLVLEPASTLVGDLLGLGADELSAVVVQARHPDLGRVEGRVDYAGRFRFASLPAGPWHITARVSGTGRFAEGRVVLQAGEETRRNLEFEGSTLTGTARFLGEPIAGASLDLRGLDSTLERRTLADPEGRFEIVDLAPGRYRISVVSRRLAVTFHRDIELLGDLDVDLDVEPVALEGQVVDGQGAPIVEALLRLEHQPEQGPSGSVLSLSTDAEGLFRIDHLPPGRHHLQVRRTGFEPLEQTVDLGPRPVETLYLPMTASPGLRLRVGGPPSERPRWLTVAVLGGAGNVERLEAQILDPSGEAWFETLPPGDLRLLVRLPGTVAAEIRATVPGPPVDVELQPAAGVDVWISELAESDRRAWLSIEGADGRPFATLDDRGLWRQQWPVADGRAAVEGLPPGLWTVRIEASDGRAWQELVESTAGNRLRIQL